MARPRYSEGVRLRSSLNLLPLAIGDVFHQYNAVMVMAASHALEVPRACHPPHSCGRRVAEERYSELRHTFYRLAYTFLSAVRHKGSRVYGKRRRRGSEYLTPATLSCKFSERKH